MTGGGLTPSPCHSFVFCLGYLKISKTIDVICGRIPQEVREARPILHNVEIQEDPEWIGTMTIIEISTGTDLKAYNVLGLRCVDMSEDHVIRLERGCSALHRS